LTRVSQERYGEKIKKQCKECAMKHPFWITNLGLLSLVLAAFAFVFISSVKIPHREDIEPSQVLPRKESKVAINIRKIYEDDLFGTYSKELPRIKQLESTIPFPEPPSQQKIVIPAIVEPEFLDPLQVTLKGIIVVGSNDSKNRAMIQDNKTMQEGTYKVGDLIQDAQLKASYEVEIIEWIPYNRFRNIQYLAQGGFSIVYKAIWLSGRIDRWNREKQQWKRFSSQLGYKDYEIAKQVNIIKLIIMKRMNTCHVEKPK
jgi:hypothetical protein